MLEVDLREEGAQEIVTRREREGGRGRVREGSLLLLPVPPALPSSLPLLFSPCCFLPYSLSLFITITLTDHLSLFLPLLLPLPRGQPPTLRSLTTISQELTRLREAILNALDLPLLTTAV